MCFYCNGRHWICRCKLFNSKRGGNLTDSQPKQNNKVSQNLSETTQLTNNVVAEKSNIVSRISTTPTQVIIYTPDNSIIHSDFSYFIVQATESTSFLGDYQCKKDNTTFICTILKINDKAQQGNQKSINVSYLNSTASVVATTEQLTNNEFYVLRAPFEQEQNIKTKSTTIIVSKTEHSTKLAKIKIVESNFGKINNLEVNGFVVKRSAWNDAKDEKKIWVCTYGSNNTQNICKPFDHSSAKNKYNLSLKHDFIFNNKCRSHTAFDVASNPTIAVTLETSKKKLLDLKNTTIKMFAKEKQTDVYPTLPTLTTQFAYGIIGDMCKQQTVFFLE